MSTTKFDYELFFELTADLFCIAGYDGYFKKINSSVSKVLGYSMEELYSRPISDFIHPEDKSTTTRFREQLLQSKPLLNFENRYLTKTGETVWLSWTSMPLDCQQVVFAIAKNITHQKEIEAQRNSLLTQLSQLNQELKQLTFSTSHDLRAPLNSMLGLIEIAKDDTAEELMIGHLEMLKENAEKLDNFICDILDYSRNSRMEIEKQKINFRELIKEVTQNLKFMGDTNRRVDFKVDIIGNASVYSDKNRLTTILNNLISNSIRYQNFKVSNPFVNIKIDISNIETNIGVEDNGIGIQQDLHPKIFDMFYRVSRESVGSGLGLYIVKNLVHLHKGKVAIGENHPSGAVFKVTLPCV